MSSSGVARRSAPEPRSPSWSPSEEMAHQNRKKLKKRRRHSDSSEDGEIDSDVEKRHREKKRHGKKQRKNKENDDSPDEESSVDTRDRKRIEENVDDDGINSSKDREYKRRDSRDQDYKSRDYRNRDYDRSYNDRGYRDNEYGRGYKGKGFRDRDFRHRDYSNRDNRDRDNRDRENPDGTFRHRNREDRELRDDDNHERGWDRSYNGRRDNDRKANRRDREEREGRYGIEKEESSNRAGTEKFDSDKQERINKQGVPSMSRDKAEEKKKAAENEDLTNVPGSIKPVTESQKKVVDVLTSKTGGAYIPPAKLKMMQAQITDKSSAAYQRIAWEALKKSIHGHINKVNTGNLATIVRELLKENLVRGCGLLCRSIIQAQAASPTFTKVYAALVSVINSRFPQIGELLLKRVVIQFKRGFRRNDKSTCISSAIFIAHLVNQDVAHEVLALEILFLLMENPTSDSVEVAIAFLKEVVEKLLLVAKKGTMAIQDMLRNILHEGTLDKRVQYMIEVMFQVIKVGGTNKEGEEEDQLQGLVDEKDQITHVIDLDVPTDGQDILNVFKLDPDYEANEAAYKKLREEILGSDSESGGEASDEDNEDSSEDSEDDEESKCVIIDKTETNLVALRRTIYLTIQSSLDFEECAHKLLRMQLKPGQELEMCHMILDCCAEMRSYEKFFGLLAQRFCMINNIYVAPFQQIFIDSYATIHRLEINKLRNVAKLFAHLLFTHAISWEVLSTCKLTEEDSTSSSRIFVKILFQELSEYMGLTKLNEQLKEPTLQPALEGLFPRDDPRNTRFAINFFTSIGLGGLTDDLREHLKSQPKTPAAQLPVPADAAAADSSSSSSTSSSSSSDSSSSDSD